MPKMELTCPSCSVIRLVQYREPSRRNTNCRHCAKFKGGRKPIEGKGWTKESWAAQCKLYGIPNAKKFDSTYSKEKHYNWKGGITSENKAVRTSLAISIWRVSVFLRDGYNCILCKQHGGLLHAHHIKPFATYPEYRFDVDNGQTLCAECHKYIHSKKLIVSQC